MTSKIEQTKRDMYSALDRIRRAKKHRKMTDEFESALEAHLQAINAIADQAQQDAITARQEVYDLHRRIQAVDNAYFESQRLLVISGDELRKAQEKYGRDRQDLLEAEKLSDDLGEMLRDAQSVIGKQEQTIVGQRLAIAELFMQVRGMKS